MLPKTTKSNTPNNGIESRPSFLRSVSRYSSPDSLPAEVSLSGGVTPRLRGAESRSAGFDRVMVRGSGSDDGRANGGCSGGVATVVDILVACVSVLG